MGHGASHPPHPRERAHFDAVPPRPRTEPPRALVRRRHRRARGGALLGDSGPAPVLARHSRRPRRRQSRLGGNDLAPPRVPARGPGAGHGHGAAGLRGAARQEPLPPAPGGPRPAARRPGHPADRGALGRLRQGRAGDRPGAGDRSASPGPSRGRVGRGRGQRPSRGRQRQHHLVPGAGPALARRAQRMPRARRQPRLLHDRGREAPARALLHRGRRPVEAARRDRQRGDGPSALPERRPAGQAALLPVGSAGAHGDRGDRGGHPRGTARRAHPARLVHPVQPERRQLPRGRGPHGAERSVAASRFVGRGPGHRSQHRDHRGPDHDRSHPPLAVGVPPSFVGLARGRLRHARPVARGDRALRGDRLLGGPEDPGDRSAHRPRRATAIGLRARAGRGGRVDRPGHADRPRVCGRGRHLDARTALRRADVGRARPWPGSRPFSQARRSLPAIFPRAGPRRSTP